MVSGDPLIGHEHGQSRTAQLMGVHLATNSQGLRDRELPLQGTALAERHGNGDTPGWLAAKDAIRQLADYCRANGIALLIAHLPELHDVKDYRFERVTALVAAAARENGVAFIDLLPWLRQEESSRLWVSPPDPHPNGRAHELIAQGLYGTLKDFP